MNFKERFESKINKTDSCWLWTAYKNNNGYGMFWLNGKLLLSHRISFTFYKEEIPEGLNICHTCDNPGCVNPKHLFLGSQKDNIKDMCLKGRAKNGNTKKTHCIRGHEFTHENTYTKPNGKRQCRQCKKDANNYMYST